MQGTQSWTSASRNVAFERQLAKALEGEVCFDHFTRGRYATDASIYQIVPQGVAFPASEADVAAALQVAGEHGVAVIARGGGTSQNGQPIGDGSAPDCNRPVRRARRPSSGRSRSARRFPCAVHVA
jgi:hypothetical protein